MSLPEIEPCKCGRPPEEDVSLRGYNHSLSCKCGEEQINYLARSNRLDACIDNWNSRVTGQPFKHAVQELPHPDTDVVSPPISRHAALDADSLRRYYRNRGAHVAGPWGGCS